MLQVQSRCMAAWENGSPQQWELGKDVFCHPPSSTFSLNGPCLLLWKNITTLEVHNRKVRIGGRNNTNLRFADDIDALAEEEQ